MSLDPSDPKTEIPAPGANGPDCWNHIGIAGDRTCLDLIKYVHCRNCPVFGSAARRFFDRPAPEGYLGEWAQWLASSDQACPQAPNEDPTHQQKSLSVLIFRLELERLAVATSVVVEVTPPRPVHHIPHRSNQILIGLSNLRGSLQLCFALDGLLGIGPASSSPSRSRSVAGWPGRAHRGATSVLESPATELALSGHFVVLRDPKRSETWVFPAHEVYGVHRLTANEVQSVPSTLANPAVSFSQGILSWEGWSVNYLDEQRVFAALRSLGQ